MSSTGPALDENDYETLAQFRYSLRSFMAFSEQEALQCGLTPQQHQALLVIRAGPAEGSTVGYLAEKLILKPHSATGLVNRLVTLGLVKRGSSILDKRQALVTLSENAKAKLATLGSAHRQELLRLRPLLLELLNRLGE